MGSLWSPENRGKVKWPALQDRMLAQMMRLESALKAPIQALKG